MEQINLREIRKTISKYIEDAIIDSRVIDILKYNEKFVPKECELWDYKEQAKSDANSLGETVLEVVSLYNAYGGYLFYGVKEINNDIEFIPVGIRQNQLNIDQLKTLVTNYTGDRIDLSYVELQSQFGSNNYLIGILYVPRRSRWQAPAIFGKNGPEIKPGSNVFKKGNIYVRLQDKCMPAETKEQLQFLYGRRDNPFLLTEYFKTKPDIGHESLVDHNLPDRNFICSKFFGRDEIIAILWRWLADDLDRTKVLAGDGGKGKTSIAFEFAEEVCRTGPYGIEKVVWLTAKKKQFKGWLDSFVDVPHTDFNDTESLLKAICSELAVLDSEIEGATIPLLKKLLSNALSNISCLIIIDDVDSTDPDDQRMILETAMQFPNTRARFLLTTRMNISYSAAACITISGLPEVDYRNYIDHQIVELGMTQLKEKQINRMRIVTDGSPLYTESLLRLCHLGMSIEDAMNKWKGKLGSEVRKAALKREIEHLLLESKRVLLACALMGQASLTELKKVTGYDDERITRCLEELKSLFLISAKPFIRQEPRFVVSNNTARLVIENSELFVTDPRLLEKEVTNLRGGKSAKGSTIVRRSVGAAITQAIALLKDNKVKDALDTVDAALDEYKNNHDLLLTRGRCLFALYRSGNDTKHLAMARRAFNKAHDFGQRKEMLYQLWYESEMAAKHSQGGIEVCTLALQDGIPSESSWLKRRANAYGYLSLDLQQSFNSDAATIQMKNCINDLGGAIHKAGSIEKRELTELLVEASDDLWEMVSSASGDIVGIRELFQTIKSCINLGDSRLIELQRLIHTVERMYQYVQHSGNFTKAQANLTRQLVREAGELLNSHRGIRSEGELLNTLRIRWQSLDSDTMQFDNASS